MKHLLILPIALFAAPYWETRDVAEWSTAELEQILVDSPWARNAGTQIYLASARPVMEAETRLAIEALPARPNAESPNLRETDYRDYLRANPGKHIILAIRMPPLEDLVDTSERRKMEQECVMKVGRKTIQIVGHFPPTRSDPYLRLLFPRVVDPVNNTISFELYIPSVKKPYRTVAFFLKEMKYKGSLEY